MPKVFLICGRICSGKSVYADVLRRENNAVILSVDEITLALFGQDAGSRLDHYVEKTKQYLYKKSLEIIEAGKDVVLDWGFWTRKEREFAREFYSSREIENVFCFIDIGAEEWKRRIKSRNAEVLEKKSDSYYVDEGLAAKFEMAFELPDRREIDIWIKQ